MADTVEIHATGTALSRPCKVYSIKVQAGAGGAATAVLRDGGAGGTEKFTQATDAASQDRGHTFGKGLMFMTDLHVTCTNVAKCYIEYE